MGAVGAQAGREEALEGARRGKQIFQRSDKGSQASVLERTTGVENGGSGPWLLGQRDSRIHPWSLRMSGARSGAES